MDSRRSRLKTKLLNALKLGTGSLVVASSVAVMPPSSDAATHPAITPVLERAAQLRSQFSAIKPADDTEAPYPLIAWWGNWHNWGRPGWHNWPNWRNWHNWGNW